jgi:ubiquinone/menaquinone biosynthesis C-methylase UbiE
LIIGISIFTHLKEDIQFKWLKELYRIARPGGNVFVTVNSDRTWFFTRPGNEKMFNVYKKQGFIDNFPNSNLNNISEEVDYVNTFHSHEYILKQWKDFFTVIDIVEGGLGGYQDVIILKKAL